MKQSFYSGCGLIALKCCEFLNSMKRENKTCKEWIRLLWTGISRMPEKVKNVELLYNEGLIRYYTYCKGSQRIVSNHSPAQLWVS